MFHRKEVGIQVLAGVAPSSQTVEYSLKSIFADSIFEKTANQLTSVPSELASWLCMQGTLS
jgi:hypothetical protein